MTDRRWLLLLGLVTALAAAGRPAQAQTEAQLVATPPAKVGPRLWEATIGVRTVFIKGAAFDPFSSGDAFAQFSLSGARVVVRSGRLALVGGAILDLGTSDSTARGAPSELSLTRISALVEGRYQPWSRLYGFVRVAPGLLHGSASMTDASSPAGDSLGTTFNAFSVDASAGAAFRIGAIGSTGLAAWLTGEGGYGWAPSERLLLTPDLGSNQSKAGALDLGSLTPGGGFFRIAFALAY
jgi:hypothetical protein